MELSLGCAYLERVVLENILDVLNRTFQITETRRLLVLQLIFKLSGKLNITCKNNNVSLVYSQSYDEKLASNAERKNFPR